MKYDPVNDQRMEEIPGGHVKIIHFWLLLKSGSRMWTSCHISAFYFWTQSAPEVMEGPRESTLRSSPMLCGSLGLNEQNM